MTDYDAAARRLQAALDAPPLSRQRVDLNDVRTLLAEHFELKSRGHRACVWPECLSEAQQLELAENVHQSMLGEESTDPDPVPDCNCAERKLVEVQAEAKRLAAELDHANSTVEAFHQTADELSDRYDAMRSDWEAVTGRAKAAEAEVVRLRSVLVDLPREWEAKNYAVIEDRNYWQDCAALAEAKRDAATARAEQAEAALADVRARLGWTEDEPDASGWSAAEDVKLEEIYGLTAAMRLRAANNRVWAVVQELRDEQNPVAQRLSAALVGTSDKQDVRKGGNGE